MKSARLFCLLFIVLVTGTLRAALSPVPVVEIIKVNLPKVEVRISNPSKTEPCIVWKPGMSWEEQTKWFSLRTAAGGKVWELRPAPQEYTRNFPNPEEIPPGKSVVRQYDLAEKEKWTLPKDFAPNGWKSEIQAHLEIPRGAEAHDDGVFIGHVTSAWHDHTGREVEKAGAPQVPEKYAATDTLKDFPMDRLHARLWQCMAGTLAKDQSLGEFFDKDFPWGPVEGRIENRTVIILLPNRQVMYFTFHDDVRDPVKSPGAWWPAKDLLAKMRGGRLRSIYVSSGPASGNGKGTGKAFARSFDKDGYMNRN